MPAQGYAVGIIENPGCDPDFMTVVEDRAWMEGQREVEMAERLILKPDSVLEYSCFNELVNELAVAGSVFSDSPSLNASFEQIVYTPLAEYIDQNFAHTFAGGTYTGAATAPCAAMNAVWDFSRCSDFNIDYFQTFQELAASDPRTVPEPCDSAARNDRWADAIALTTFPPAVPAVPGGADGLQSYNTLITAGSCTGTPIETGVTVARGSGEYNDAVCPNPYCSYNGASGCAQ